MVFMILSHLEDFWKAVLFKMEVPPSLEHYVYTLAILKGFDYIDEFVKEG